MPKQSDTVSCPNCTTTMEHDPDARDFACSKCGLAGPRDVLEAIAANVVDTCNSAFARGTVCGIEACARALRALGGSTSSAVIAVVVNGMADAFDESAKQALAQVKLVEVKRG